MAAKLTGLTQKIAIQLHLVAESCTICSSHSGLPVRKLLSTPSYERLISKERVNKFKTATEEEFLKCFQGWKIYIESGGELIPTPNKV
jgi:hypothetical protein